MNDSKPGQRPDRLRVLVADDHDLIRYGVRQVLKSGGCEVCGDAADGREAVNLARRLKPDVAVLDIGMPEMNGIEATRKIRAEVPRCQVVILTCHDSEQLVREALVAGARGFVLKEDASSTLVAAVTKVAAGGSYLSRMIDTVVLTGYLRGQADMSSERVGQLQERLSTREREVVQLLSEGKSNKHIAATLGISIRAAETHRTNVMRKLGLHSLSEVIHFAIRNEIVEA